MHYVKRLYITLLEMLLVLAILGIFAGFFGVNIARAMREQRFNNEANLVISQLRLAQDLMLIFNSNLSLVIQSHPDGIAYALKFDEKLPTGWNRWEKEVTRLHPKLTTIKQVNFEDQLDLSSVPQEANKLEVKFHSGGDKMSYGIMRLSTSAHDEDFGAITRYICLSGYPKPIYSQTERPSEDSCLGLEDAFMEQLTQKTAEEIREKE